MFRLQGASRLAVDTEFMRESTYRAQLCLVQIASDTDCYLVDPLAGLDLAPLFATLADRARPKILHAARQDLEVLLQTGGFVPAPVFDTQVAAALLGLPPQAGYAELVARQLGHSIDKGQTRTDWSRRPLSAAQLAYAADDVHHLLQLHTELAMALEARGRSAWHAEECAALENPALYRTEPGDAWRRFKGLGRLRPPEQSVARALAAWREERAIASDKPRGWILTDEAVLALATLAPTTMAELEQVRALPPGVVRKRGDELLALVRSGARGHGGRGAVAGAAATDAGADAPHRTAAAAPARRGGDARSQPRGARDPARRRGDGVRPAGGIAAAARVAARGDRGARCSNGDCAADRPTLSRPRPSGTPRRRARPAGRRSPP